MWSLNPVVARVFPVGTLTDEPTLDTKDIRKGMPCFAPEACAANLGATRISLIADLMVRQDALINHKIVTGARYDAQATSEVDTEEYVLRRSEF